MCLSRNSSEEGRTEFIAATDTVVRSIAYDWMAGNIYWLNGGRNCSIELAKKNGLLRRKLISHQTEYGTYRKRVLDNPRCLAIAPKAGYAVFVS